MEIIVSRDICDLKQRLLYFELITTHALFKLSKSSVNNGAVHLAAKNFYQRYDQVKDQDNNFIEIACQFDSHLQNLSKIRTEMVAKLTNITNDNETRRLFKEMDSQLNDIFQLIKDDKPVGIKKISYEELLGQLINTVAGNKIFLLNNFSNAELIRLRRMVIILHVLRAWQATLTQEFTKLQDMHAIGLLEVFVIKKLLFNQKVALLKKWLKELTESSEGVNDLLVKEIQFAQKRNERWVDAPVIIHQLENQLTVARTQIALQEHKLRQLYSWPQGIKTGIARGLTGNAYYEFSEMGFSTVESGFNSPQLQNIPIVNVKLTENYNSFFKGATASAILAWELWGMRNDSFAVPFFMLQTISRWFTDFNVLFYLFNKIGKDEYDVIHSEPIIRMSIGLGVVLASQAMRTWLQGLSWNWFVVMLCIGHYFSAVAGEKILGKVGQKLFGEHSNLGTICAYAGFLIGGAFFLKSIDFIESLTFIQGLLTAQFSDAELLKRKELCERYPDACQAAARRKLGAGENDSINTIRRLCRQNAFNTHPDKVTDESENIILINQACQILKSL